MKITDSDLLAKIRLPLGVLKTMFVDEFRNLTDEQAMRYQAFVLGFIVAMYNRHNCRSELTEFLRFYTKKTFGENAEMMWKHYLSLIAENDDYLYQKDMGYKVAQIMDEPGSMANYDPESMFRAAVWDPSKS